MKNVDLTKVHYLSGPLEIETAEPGDVLIVEIQDVQPFQDQPWGFTGVFDKKNGGGFLDEIYPNALAQIHDLPSTPRSDSIVEQKLSGTLKASSVLPVTSHTFVSPD